LKTSAPEANRQFLSIEFHLYQSKVSETVVINIHHIDNYNVENINNFEEKIIIGTFMSVTEIFPFMFFVPRQE
jgi:hypothetical protein